MGGQGIDNDHIFSILPKCFLDKILHCILHFFALQKTRANTVSNAYAHLDRENDMLPLSVPSKECIAPFLPRAETRPTPCR